jgi:hypothetical protein
MMMSKLMKRLKMDESGQAVVLVALMMTVLLGMGALVVDYGYMTVQKSQLQTAADAAALAGARSIYVKTSDQIKALAEQTAQANLKDPVSVTTTPIRADGVVTVEVSQIAPKFFAGVLTNADTHIRAKASAKADGFWNGEAFPFINMHEPIQEGKDIWMWEKEDSGFFSRIDPQYGYNIVDFTEGVATENGKMAFIKEEIEQMYLLQKPLYVFSLKSEVMEKGTLVNRGSGLELVFSAPYEYLNVNKPVVKLEHLLVLEVFIKSYDAQAKEMELNILEILDNPNGTITSEFVNSQKRVYLFE